MDLLVVVLEQLVLLGLAQAPERLPDVPRGVLAAHHEPDLAGWVGRDGRVRILDDGEDLVADSGEVLDELKVEPLVLG